MNTSEYNNESHDTDDVDSLVREADRRRDRIENTLNVLGGKLSPEHLKEQAFDLFSEHSGDIASGISRSVKNNPVPLILTGVGIAWMMMSQRDDRQSGGYQRDEYQRGGYRGQYSEFRQPPMDTRHVPDRRAFSDRHSTDTDSSSAEGLTDKLSDARDTLVEGASNGWDSVTGSARDARDATGERLESMRDQSAAMSDHLQQQYHSAAHSANQTAVEWANDASRFMREQPLVAGALGIALGALIGGLLPTSDKERQLARQAVNSDAGKAVVDRSEEVLDDARAEASTRIEQAGEIAMQKAREIRESAKSEA